MRRAGRSPEDSSSEDFLVQVNRPGGRPPRVRIIKTDARRKPGASARGRSLRTIGGPDAFDQAHVDRTSQEIGAAIVQGSSILGAWAHRRPEAPASGVPLLAVLRELCNRGGAVSRTVFESIRRAAGYDPRGAGVLFKELLRRTGDKITLTEAAYERLGDLHIPPRRRRVPIPAPVRLPGRPLSEILLEGRG